MELPQLYMKIQKFSESPIIKINNWHFIGTWRKRNDGQTLIAIYWQNSKTGKIITHENFLNGNKN